jgi:gamma-glutamyl:cysteine ligase YbdK (ATP-grasp superfamily)
MPSARTLGIEEELQIVDSDTLKLAFRAPQLLSRLPDEGYTSEWPSVTPPSRLPIVKAWR